MVDQDTPEVKPDAAAAAAVAELLTDGEIDKHTSPTVRKPPSDMEMMKERFAKLLLGEDMSGGGKGVSSALALSNAITNLAASVFGEQSKLEPMSPERKARWNKEVGWLLSVSDYIVEFVACQQKSKDGSNMEVMMTRQRSDLLVNIPALRKLDGMLLATLDNFSSQQEFWYASKNAGDSEKGVQRDEEKWWLPTVKVPPNGLSNEARQFLHKQKEAVNQVLKASMAINAQILSDMEIPENYIESLPKHGKVSLGESTYKLITDDYFDPQQFLSTMDLSSEHSVLDLKNRIEASVVIWKRKLHTNYQSSWGLALSTEKRELIEERAETVLLLLKHHFPGLPQSSLDISKIQYNRDVGLAILESYSRVLESLANTVMSRIEDVLFADSVAQNPSHLDREKEDCTNATPSPTLSSSSPSAEDKAEKLSPAEGTTGSMTLSDFMGWEDLDPGETEITNSTQTDNLDSTNTKDEQPVGSVMMKFLYLDRIDRSYLRSPIIRN